MHRHAWVTPSERRYRSSSAPTTSPSNARSPATALLDSRCPLCTWAGTTDADECPQCGHGLLEYNVYVYE